MSTPIKMSVTPTQETRMGRMLAAGRLTATVKSKRTGQHITVEFASKVKENNRWQNASFNDATHVFISGGRGNKIGTYYPQKDNLYFNTEDAAWQFAVKQILFAVQSGVQDHEQFEITESEHCGRCGLTLTDPISIARGLGPHCADMETGSVHYRAEPKDDAEREMEAEGAMIEAEELRLEERDAMREEGHFDRKGRELPKTFAEMAARIR